MVTYVALYRGHSITSARVIAVSSRRALIHHVAAELLDDPHYVEDAVEDDVVLEALNQGRRRALTLVAGEEERHDR